MESPNNILYLLYLLLFLIAGFIIHKSCDSSLVSLEVFPQRKSCWSCRSCNCYTSLYFYFSTFSMFIQSRISKSVVSSQTHAAEIFRILSFVTWVEFLECYDRQHTKWPWLLTNISVNTIEARNFWITCCCFLLFFFILEN